MRIPGSRTARFWVRWLKNVGAQKAVILGYHRVTKNSWDPYGNAVSPEHFSQHLEVMHRYANPMPLGELVANLKVGKVPERALAVTLDDGYLDNLTIARPLLKQWKVPATVFAVSGNFGREFWWDELSRRFAPPNPLPRKLTIKSSEVDITFQTPQSPRREARLRSLRELHDILFTGPRETIADVLEQLRGNLGAEARGEPWHRCMTEEELCELAEDPLIEIGAHTESHRPMAYLDEIEQREEITQCKAKLEQLLGRPVPLFSYPHGSYLPTLGGLVKAAGHSSSCAANANVVRSDSDPFSLPRLWAANCDGPQFSRWLRFWLCS